MTTMKVCIGFEFTIRYHNGATDRVRLQGYGGLYGDGCLYQLCDRDAVSRAKKLAPKILSKAALENGRLRVFREHRNPLKRITLAKADVIECHPIFEERART